MDINKFIEKYEEFSQKVFKEIEEIEKRDNIKMDSSKQCAYIVLNRTFDNFIKWLKNNK